MFPLIPSGSWLLLCPAEGRKIRAGDVVVFPGHGGMVTHRVLAIDATASPAQLTVRGDAQRGSERVPLDAVAYVVEAIHHRGFSYRTDSPLGRLASALCLRGGPSVRILGALARRLVGSRRLATDRDPAKRSK